MKLLYCRLAHTRHSLWLQTFVTKSLCILKSLQVWVAAQWQLLTAQLSLSSYTISICSFAIDSARDTQLWSRFTPNIRKCQPPVQIWNVLFRVLLCQVFVMLVICFFVCVKIRRTLQFQKISRGRYPESRTAGFASVGSTLACGREPGRMKDPRRTSCVWSCNHLSEINVSWFCRRLYRTSLASR